MTQEEKQLLLQDLSTRLPYGVMVLEDINEEFDGGCVSKLATITEIKGEKMFLSKNSLTPVTIEEIRPYLRPMSSMTKEEYEIYHELIGGMFGTGILINLPILEDFLNKNMFDYRGLIPMGLALETHEGMY